MCSLNIRCGADGRGTMGVIRLIPGGIGVGFYFSSCTTIVAVSGHCRFFQRLGENGGFGCGVLMFMREYQTKLFHDFYKSVMYYQIGLRRMRSTCNGSIRSKLRRSNLVFKLDLVSLRNSDVRPVHFCAVRLRGSSQNQSAVAPPIRSTSRLSGKRTALPLIFPKRTA